MAQSLRNPKQAYGLEPVYLNANSTMTSHAVRTEREMRLSTNIMSRNELAIWYFEASVVIHSVRWDMKKRNHF
jgi:hypothetical protein